MGGRDHSYECATCGEMRGGFDDLECRCTDENGSRVLAAYFASRNKPNPPAVPDGSPLTGSQKAAIGYRTGRLDATDAALAWLSGELPGDDENLAWCPEERRHDAWSWCLAHNLAVAGGMELSWRHALDDHFGDIRWRPGCGRPAPGWGGGE